MALKIITANKVKNGAVVYLSAEKWSERINDSAVSSSEKEEKKLEEKAKKSVETQVVIDPYLIEVIQKKRKHSAYSLQGIDQSKRTNYRS